MKEAFIVTDIKIYVQRCRIILNERTENHPLILDNQNLHFKSEKDALAEAHGMQVGESEITLAEAVDNLYDELLNNIRSPNLNTYELTYEGLVRR